MAAGVVKMSAASVASPIGKAKFRIHKGICLLIGFMDLVRWVTLI
jgi:hypothetical protein